MTITPLEWISIAVGAVIAVAARFRIPALRTPRVTDRMDRSMRSWWPFGEALLRGWIRRTPTAIGGLWIALGIVVVGVPSTGAQPGTALYALGSVLIPLIVMLVLWLAAIMTIVLFDRPRFLVAPHLRTDPGAISTWFHPHSGQRRSTRRLGLPIAARPSRRR
jgi:uncharacterized membrane protein YedE/YeeE